MDSFYIYMKSFTQAQKAKEFLQKRGIRSIVERSFKNGKGCGFALRVTGGRHGMVSRDEVCTLLKQIGITCDIS